MGSKHFVDIGFGPESFGEGGDLVYIVFGAKGLGGGDILLRLGFVLTSALNRCSLWDLSYGLQVRSDAVVG